MAVIWQPPIADSDSEEEHPNVEAADSSENQAQEAPTSPPQEVVAPPEPKKTKKRKRPMERYPREVKLIGPSTFTLHGYLYKMPRIRFVRPDDETMEEDADLNAEDLQLALGNDKKQPDPDPAPVNMFQFQYAPFEVTQRQTFRMRNSRAERVPPIRADGRRYCPDCMSEVRPQMCGGKQFRWRCIGKQHRKWYDAVQVGEALPADRRGMRILWTQGSSQDVESAAHDYASENANSIWPRTNPKVISKSASSQQERKRRRTPSPLTRYNNNWLDHKPELLPPKTASQSTHLASMMHVSSAFLLIGNAMKEAAATIEQDSDNVHGTLDLMMDSLVASMAPLCGAVNRIPGVNIAKKTCDKHWGISANHMPLPR